MWLNFKKIFLLGYNFLIYFDIDAIISLLVSCALNYLVTTVWSKGLMIVETNAVNKIQLCRNRPYIFLCEEAMFVCLVPNLCSRVV